MCPYSINNVVIALSAGMLLGVSLIGLVLGFVMFGRRP